MIGYRGPLEGGLHNYVNGGRGGTRTPDLLVRSQALYPTELHARRSIVPFGSFVHSPLGDVVTPTKSSKRTWKSYTTSFASVACEFYSTV